MTIKPAINQKSNEKNKDHSNNHNQVDQQVSTNGNSHRNLSNSNVESYSQSPQRRNDVFDDISRHRRSPHKNIGVRQKRNNEHHHTTKRLNENREKLNNASPATQQYLNQVISVTQHHADRISPHSHSTSINVNTTSPITCPTSKSPKHSSSVNNSNILITQTVGSVSPKCQLSPRSNSISSITNNNNSGEIVIKQVEETLNGYNSGDEWMVSKEEVLSPDEWTKRDEQFGKAMENRGLIIKDVEEDGACLFRAISLQIYGDQEMHDFIRQQTMDYIYQNSEYFAQFVTEDINNYVKRKRNIDSHGNHIEIQAMSELYNRPVELYCYQTTPINIFNSEQISNGQYPLRLSYQRGSHYNAILDPYNASVGVGLGLAGYKPDSQTNEAMQLSEQLEIEQTMFEDKLKTTDWEATNEALQEQVARESYLQWCRENMLKNRNNKSEKHNKISNSSKSEENASTITSATCMSSTSSSSTITSAEAFKSSFVKQLKNQSTTITFTESCYITSIKTTTASSLKNNIIVDSLTLDNTPSCNKHKNYDNDNDNNEKIKNAINIDDNNSNNTFPKISDNIATNNNNININNKNNENDIEKMMKNENNNYNSNLKINIKNNVNRAATTSNYQNYMFSQILRKNGNESNNSNSSCSSLSVSQYNSNNNNHINNTNNDNNNINDSNNVNINSTNNNNDNNNSNNNRNNDCNATLSEKNMDNNSNKLNDSTEYCYDSDDTDMSSTSSIEQHSEMLGFNSKIKNSSGGDERKKSRRLKRKLRENLWYNPYSNASSYIFSPKKFKINDAQSKVINLYNNKTSSFECNQNLVLQNCIEKQPSTSKRHIEEKSLSLFYQSLLESSYTDDGIGQLTENEMIQKAIEMSRMDYFKDQELKFSYFQVQQQDNDDDST